MNKDYPCPRCDLVASNLAAYSAHADEQGHWGYSHAEMTAMRKDVERLRILETAANATAHDLAKQNDELETALGIAHGGLRRALDYRAATPEGLAIKADIRKTLIESGDPGPWGVVGSG